MQVISRLVAPASELATATWVSRTALSALLGERLAYVDKDALYRTSDQLWEKRQKIESFLAGQELHTSPRNTWSSDRRAESTGKELGAVLLKFG